MTKRNSFTSKAIIKKQRLPIGAFCALIAALDLVISVDNTTVHESGAVGIPTWMLTSYPAHWRWMMHVDDTPWYKNFWLVRQKAKGEWDLPIKRVAKALQQYVDTGSLPVIDPARSWRRLKKGIVCSGKPSIETEFTPSKPEVVSSGLKVGRNDPCSCGGGKKYKKCCGKM
jgi:hypothetical protein